MRKFYNFIVSKLILFLFSLHKTEKGLLTNQNNSSDDNTNNDRRATQGQLADSLLNGEITKEVENFRWRTYKILRQMEGLESTIIGYDDDGFPIVETKKINRKESLSKIKLDEYDDYELEMVVDNTPITVSIADTLKTINDDELIDEIQHNANFKNTYPLTIKRKIISSFDIEKYTKKLNVRIIDNDKRLLEFYISKYPDIENKTHKLFINKLKKTIDNPNSSNIFNIDGVYFITNKTIGVVDLLEFEFNNLIYDKTIEFDGYYVVKFVGEIEKNGLDLTNKYLKEKLETKYCNKEEKKWLI